MSQEPFGPVGMELCTPVCWQIDPEWVAQGHGCSPFLQALCKALAPQVNASDGPNFGFLKPHGLCCSKTPGGNPL